MEKNVNNRLKIIRKKIGLDQQQFAEKIGLSRSRYCEYEKGKTAFPLKYAKTVCAVFDIFEPWLLSGEGEMKTVKSAVGIYRIPVLGHVPAGFPKDIPNNEIIDFIELPDTKDNKNIFALVISGDCMKPSLMPGDYVLFRPNGDHKDGDIVIFNNEFGESSIKRFKEISGEKFLVCDNPAFSMVKVKGGFHCLGVVVGAWRRVKV